jgi:hypothetical protein
MRVHTQQAAAVAGATEYRCGRRAGNSGGDLPVKEEGAMKASGMIVGLVITVAIIWFVIKAQYSQGPAGSQPPAEVINITGVKSDLLAIAQAERLYLATHGTYVSVDELQQDGSITFSGANRRGYSYTAEVDGGQHFKITATPTDPAKAGWPTLSIDETMQETQQ